MTAPGPAGDPVRRSAVARRLLGDLPSAVGVLAAVAFAVALGFGIVAPVIPLFAREFGVGNAAAGAVVSAFALMRLTSALAGGRLVELFGERAVLAAGLGIVAVSSVLAGLAQSYPQLLVLRGVGGVGSAMFTVSAVSLLLRIVRSDQRGRASAWFQGGFLAGGVAGPAFGGALATISLRAPFFVYAGTLAAALAITVTALRGAAGPPVTADGTSPPRSSLRAAFADPAYRAALVTNLGNGWVLFGIRSSLIPLFVADVLGRTAFWVGIGFLVGSLTQAAALWPAGRIVDQVGRKPAMVGGSVLGVASMALLIGIQTLPGFLAAMALYGIAAAFLGVAPAAVVGDVVEGQGGRVVATFQMAADIGAVAGPLLAGWLADEVNFTAALGAGAIVIGVAAVLAARMPETRQTKD
ncbi:MAG TPA: MFS transporter [Jiangellaceae bacterium]|nr:MFS transporter [Jiangellaceae bacterium]